MIPLRDNIPSQTVPFVNYAIIAACALVFWAQLRGGRQDPLVERYGMIPARVLEPDEPVMVPDVLLVETPFGMRPQRVSRPAEDAAVPAWLTLVTCIFLHGGWMHFLGNMWFLFIFGDNVEDRMGHGGYLVFYLAAGVAASVVHLVTNAGSPVPTIGASGAIAGVMGAYMFLYPRAHVLAVIPIFIILEMIVLPAPVFLGIWFVIQFFQGVFSITSTQATGVAWWAHIGGFLAGAAVAALLNQWHWLNPRVEQTRPNTDHVTAYRVYPRSGGRRW